MWYSFPGFHLSLCAPVLRQRMRQLVSGAAKLRHGKATQMSRSFRLYSCWHWLSGRRPNLPGAWYAGYRSRPSIRPIGFSRRPGRSSMCDRSRGLADLSSGGNDSSANAALAGPDDLELSLVANFFHAASRSPRWRLKTRYPGDRSPIGEPTTLVIE